MPGMWITRDPDTGEVAGTRTEDEMSASLRAGNKESPAYVAEATERWFRIDWHTVGVAAVGGPVTAIYRWEFDVFEGEPKGGRVPPVELVRAARHMGLSIRDFIASPGSATSRARAEATADRTGAVRAADALLHTLRQLAAVREDGMSFTMRMFLSTDNTPDLDAGRMLEPSAYAVTKTALLAVLAKLAGGDQDRARRLYIEVAERGQTISHVLPAWEERWVADDYANRSA